MLELGQLMTDLGRLSERTRLTQTDLLEQLEVAIAQAGKSGDEWARMSARIRDANTKWLNAVPLDDHTPIAVPIPAAPSPGRYTVVATDGSQIPLDRHAAVPYFVINVGIVKIHYGTPERPSLTSDARLYFGDEELLFDGPDGEACYAGERQIAAERTKRATGKLAGPIEECASHENVLGLVDGTLILWAQEGDAAQLRREAVDQLVGLQASALRSGALLAGYISRPRSREVINALKVTLYPEGVTNYKDASDTQLPGRGLNRLTDALLFDRLLDIGQRSPVFESRSRILREYETAAAAQDADAPESFRIAFFYSKIAVGSRSEIARIECPVWLATDQARLDLMHSLIVDQTAKGLGYPIALQEAHEQAVVRAPERDAFLRLVERRCVRDGIAITTSQKSMAKQVRFI